MRTTLTLDPDVAAHLERLRKTDDRSFKEIVNELLRAGLRNLDDRREERQPRQYTKTVDLGKPLIPLDNIAEALALAEGEDYK